ncbi:putative membrane protein [Breznakia sp. PF5-3]|uniref:hypothetical protein n=1 Tax=unclassified Breznakia TaxID=2623764 RepID=UPI002406E218|nr:MULTISPECIES: hypothetical protein [unclassified Breznakia]MDF9824509.1 putative membrane protein [Breznakia sp. PM6-1]MDF9835295.1 putative membrane protein [Breznakia sp. PF5-3]MDF9837011.1 putative membrane protein [Breznakia sp. PFB2-8]MDF9858936.1 putative membrane protein [Breznakia sp. PH5-24]
MLTKDELKKIDNLEKESKQLLVHIKVLIAMRIIASVFLMLFLVSAYLSNIDKIPSYIMFIFLSFGVIVAILSGIRSKYGEYDGESLLVLRRRIKSIKNEIDLINKFASQHDDN